MSEIVDDLLGSLEREIGNRAALFHWTPVASTKLLREAHGESGMDRLVE